MLQKYSPVPVGLPIFTSGH